MKFLHADVLSSQADTLPSSLIDFTKPQEYLLACPSSLLVQEILGSPSVHARSAIHSHAVWSQYLSKSFHRIYKVVVSMWCHQKVAVMVHLNDRLDQAASESQAHATVDITLQTYSRMGFLVSNIISSQVPT